MIKSSESRRSDLGSGMAPKIELHLSRGAYRCSAGYGTEIKCLDAEDSRNVIDHNRCGVVRTLRASRARVVVNDAGSTESAS